MNQHEVILEVLQAKKRPLFAYGLTKCRVVQGTLMCGVRYFANFNTPDGPEYEIGSMKPNDIPTGGEATVLMYCPKEMLPTVKTMYVKSIT